MGSVIDKRFTTFRKVKIGLRDLNKKYVRDGVLITVAQCPTLKEFIELESGKNK
jgi:hypothetical protein